MNENVKEMLGWLIEGKKVEYRYKEVANSKWAEMSLDLVEDMYFPHWEFRIAPNEVLAKQYLKNKISAGLSNLESQIKKSKYLKGKKMEWVDAVMAQASRFASAALDAVEYADGDLKANLKKIEIEGDKLRAMLEKKAGIADPQDS